MPTPNIALGHNSSPYISIYPWSGSSFGTKVSDPATLPSSGGRGVAFTAAADAIAVAHSNSPRISVYPWSGTSFGTKFSDPGTAPDGNGTSVTFTSNDDAIAIGHFTSPYIAAYPWSGSGFGSKFSNPGTLPVGYVLSCRFVASDAIVMTGNAGTIGFPWSGSGFGTKFTNPTGTGVGSNCNDLNVATGNNVVAVAERVTPWVEAFPFSTSTGWGTKFSNPGTNIGARGYGVAFSKADDVLAISTNGGVGYGVSNITAYAWSGSGFGSRFADPGTQLGGTSGRFVTFNTDDSVLFAGSTGSPYINAYPWSSSGFGSKFNNPSTLPPATVFGVAYTGTPVPVVPLHLYPLFAFNQPVGLFNRGWGFGIFLR